MQLDTEAKPHHRVNQWVVNKLSLYYPFIMIEGRGLILSLMGPFLVWALATVW